jgi:RNA polymerase sigma-70 factor (ECF subfamily)
MPVDDRPRRVDRPANDAAGPDPGLDPEDEAALRAAILAGSTAAWDRLYARGAEPVHRFLLARARQRLGPAWLRDHSLVDEAYQETWLVAVRRLDRFDPERAPFVAWLFGIAERVWLDVARRHGRGPQSLGVPETGQATPAATDAETDDVDTTEAIAAALAGLPPAYAAALREKYLENDDVRSIAARRGLGAKAAESLLGRARAAFRRLYRSLTGETCDEGNEA